MNGLEAENRFSKGIKFVSNVAFPDIIVTLVKDDYSFRKNVKMADYVRVNTNQL